MERKRILCICLAVIMLIGLLPGVASASSERFVIAEAQIRISLSNQPISYERPYDFTVRVGTTIIQEARSEEQPLWLTRWHSDFFEGFYDLITVPVHHGSEGRFVFETPGKYTVGAPVGGGIFRFTVVDDIPPPQPSATPFTDISGHWATDAIEFIYKRGLMNGITATTFAPDARLNRAMVATILYRMAGEPAVGFRPVFTDVSAGQWYSNAIIWAFDAGIVEGTSPTTFAPGANITREQFATMMHRYAHHGGQDLTVPSGFNLNQFTDRDAVSTWATDAMLWANYHGLITGRTATTIDPAGTATRAECATILMRFIEAFPENTPPAVRIDIYYAIWNVLWEIGDAGLRQLLGEPIDIISHPSPHGGEFIESIFSDGLSVSGFGIRVDYQQAENLQRFHFRGINGISTRDDVVTLMGRPDFYNATSYVFDLGETYVFAVEFDHNFRVIQISINSTL